MSPAAGADSPPPATPLTTTRGSSGGNIDLDNVPPSATRRRDASPDVFTGAFAGAPSRSRTTAPDMSWIGGTDTGASASAGASASGFGGFGGFGDFTDSQRDVWGADANNRSASHSLADENARLRAMLASRSGSTNAGNNRVMQLRLELAKAAAENQKMLREASDAKLAAVLQKIENENSATSCDVVTSTIAQPGHDGNRNIGTGGMNVPQHLFDSAMASLVAHNGGKTPVNYAVAGVINGSPFAIAKGNQ
mgnify:CR=1 FL=1